MTSKLNKDVKLKNEYRKINSDYKEKGIMETVDPPPPHRPLLESPPRGQGKQETTKVRIVFDGSAKINRNEPSLNDTLYAGLLPYKFDILVHFRIRKIAVVAYLKQEFLQIGVAVKYQDELRFIWLHKPNDLASEEEILRFAESCLD